jgi:LysM repeat protein
LSYFNFSFASLDDITFSIENNKIIRKKEIAQKNQKENLEKIEEKRKISVLKNQNYYVYIVKRGDNLFKISKKFGISIQKLIEINNFF